MTRRPGRRSVVAAGALLLLAATGCSTSSESTTAETGFGGDGGIAMIDVADRRPAPDVVGEKLGGGKVSVTDWTGRPSVVNIWASWCGPCRKEAPELAQAAGRMTDVRFVGIAIRDNAAAAESFEANHRLPYGSVLDPDGSIVLGFHGLVNPSALPYTVVIDSHGRIGAVIAGATTAATLEGVVRDVEKGT